MKHMGRVAYGLGIVWSTVGLTSDNLPMLLVGSVMIGAGAAFGWSDE